MRHRNREQIDMAKKHEHIGTVFVSYDKDADITTGRCACGALCSFPALAKNRMSAWSAHGAGSVYVAADEERLVKDNGWTVNERD